MTVSVVMVASDEAAASITRASPELADAEVVVEPWRPGEAIARARWRAFQRATGDWVISLGECYSPAPGWMPRVRAAVAGGDADVIAGAVSISREASRAARAQYSWEYADAAPGALARVRPERIPGGHAVYRRAVLRESDFAGAWSELDYHAAMFGRGLRLLRAPELVVEYRPDPRYLARRFGWSRAEGAHCVAGWGTGKRVLSAAARLALPPVLIARAAGRTGPAGAPMLADWCLFAAAQAAGEIVGRAVGR